MQGSPARWFWHQATPDGTVAVVYLEADDIPAAMQAMATSDPFDQRFRQLLKEVRGIDLTEGGRAPSSCTKRPSEAPPAAAPLAWREQRPTRLSALLLVSLLCQEIDWGEGGVLVGRGG